ncbi:hypothetical protein [Pontibacter korlensis]|nr:hypothetical protein [Pontibacter korlensis]
MEEVSSSVEAKEVLQLVGQTSLNLKGEKHPTVKRKQNTSELLAGTWVHEEDSLAVIEITDTTFSFVYQVHVADKYRLHIADELTQFINPDTRAKYLVLSNQADTLYDELNGIDKHTLSLTWFPTMRAHVYKRVSH